MKKFGADKNFLIAIGLWGGFFTYLWLNLVHEGPSGINVGAAYMWADWALHTIVASVATYRPVSCWFDNHPVFLGLPFDYPFVVDFISGLMHRIGFSLSASFIWPSIVLTLMFLSGIYLFAEKITKSSLQSFLVLSLLLLNGGLGFIEALRDWQVDPNFFDQFPKQIYSHITQKGLHYGNMTITEFIPQRAFLLGMPITLFLMGQLFSAVSAPLKSRKMGVLGLLAGLLLFVHPHSYLVLVMFSILITLMHPQKIRTWIPYAAGAFFPSLVWLLFMHGHGNHSGFFEWHPGWIAYEPENGCLGFVHFWLLNWSVMLIFAVIGTYRYRLYRNPIIIFGWFLFAICNLVKFQPWSWDNTKLFTYSYLILAIPVASCITELFEDKLWRYRVSGFMLLLSMILTGLIDFYGLLKRATPGYQMYSRDEMDLAAEVRKLTDPCDIILTGTDHHHWLPALTGRQILMGYPGWVGSYGIDYAKREFDIRTIYSGTSESMELIKKYGIRHILIGPKEIAEFKPNEAFFAEHFQPKMSLKGTVLYDATAYH